MGEDTSQPTQIGSEKKPPQWVKGFKKSQLISFFIHTALMFTLPVLVYFQSAHYLVKWGIATQSNKDMYAGGAAVLTVNLIIFSFVLLVYLDPDSFVDQTDPTKTRTVGGNLIPNEENRKTAKSKNATQPQGKSVVTDGQTESKPQEENKPAQKKKYSERKKTHEKAD